MKRSLFATLFLVGMCALATGSQAASPARTTTIAPAAPAPQIGGCRWYCGSKPFLTRSACDAACTTDVCEPIC